MNATAPDVWAMRAWRLYFFSRRMYRAEALEVHTQGFVGPEVPVFAALLCSFSWGVTISDRICGELFYVAASSSRDIYGGL
jgi:hypothetical protein